MLKPTALAEFMAHGAQIKSSRCSSTTVNNVATSVSLLWRDIYVKQIYKNACNISSGEKAHFLCLRNLKSRCLRRKTLAKIFACEVRGSRTTYRLAVCVNTERLFDDFSHEQQFASISAQIIPMLVLYCKLRYTIQPEWYIRITASLIPDNRSLQLLLDLCVCNISTVATAQLSLPSASICKGCRNPEQLKSEQWIALSDVHYWFVCLPPWLDFQAKNWCTAAFSLTPIYTVRMYLQIASVFSSNMFAIVLDCLVNCCFCFSSGIRVCINCCTG